MLSLKNAKDGSLYKGSTKNLKKRIESHNSGSARYSAPKKLYILIWYCAFPNKAKALRFEKYLKHGSGAAFAKNI